MGSVLGGKGVEYKPLRDGRRRGWTLDDTSSKSPGWTSLPTGPAAQGREEEWGGEDREGGEGHMGGGRWGRGKDREETGSGGSLGGRWPGPRQRK